jgi:predicted Zn-dependent protease
MQDTLRRKFKSLHSSAPFYSLRFVDETREQLAVRQDTIEPPRLQADRGAMLVAVSEGGYGYCATSDLSTTGLQAALDRATEWARATRTLSVHRYTPETMPAPRGERLTPQPGTSLSRRELFDLLADECRNANIDERIVERYAGLDLRRVEQLYLTNTGGDVLQQFVYTVPYAHVTANAGTETQTRTFLDAQQGGLDRIPRTGFVGCGKRLAEEALQLLLAPNCPAARMDLLLMPDQMMLQIRAQLRRHELRYYRHVRAVSVRLERARRDL